MTTKMAILMMKHLRLFVATYIVDCIFLHCLYFLIFDSYKNICLSFFISKNRNGNFMIKSVVMAAVTKNKFDRGNVILTGNQIDFSLRESINV